jgi:enoyl-CoA hydratase/carnithine racemase
MNQKKTATWHRQGAFGFLTLRNPPQNLLTDPVFMDPGTLRAGLGDPELKGAVVAGDGRHFCGGADLEALEKACADPAALEERLRLGGELLRILATAPVPVVAAVRGGCLGAGLEIALACLFRIAGEKAVFGFPESGQGLIPGLGGAVRLRDAVSPLRAAEMILRGGILSAGEAERSGLIHRVVEDAAAADEAVRFLEELTGHLEARVVHAVMKALHAADGPDRAEALRAGTTLFCSLAEKFGSR